MSKSPTVRPIAKFLLKQQSKSDSGFTLMEVIVASIMVFLFVVGSMQALALSVAVRIKAQERQRADQLIQEDIAQVKLVAENLNENSSLCSATTYTGGYAKALADDSDFPSGTPTKNLIESNTNSPEYTLTRTIDTTNSTSTILKIDYEVKKTGDTRVIATDYIEVIPNEAVKCP